MNKMITFDSFTLIPAYSDISSRSEVDISFSHKNIKSNLPIINANMLAICTTEMIKKISDDFSTCSSYHRFFETKEHKINKISEIKNTIKSINIFFPSIGVQTYDYEYIDWLAANNFKNVIVDVNHGHHKLVHNIITYIKTNYKHITIMAGNVSSTDGISYLADAGVDIIKIGNSFGLSCTTKKASGFGVHPLHVAKKYREDTNNNDTVLCLDGGIREVADIAKSLIWGDLVMLGGMLGGCDESFGTKINNNGLIFKEYFGNASIKTKMVMSAENHIKNIEGTTKLINCTGPIDHTLKNIKEGLQSAFSFVGARNIKQYKNNAINNILYI